MRRLKIVVRDKPYLAHRDLFPNTLVANDSLTQQLLENWTSTKYVTVLRGVIRGKWCRFWLLKSYYPSTQTRTTISYAWTRRPGFPSAVELPTGFISSIPRFSGRPNIPLDYWENSRHVLLFWYVDLPVRYLHPLDFSLPRSNQATRQSTRIPHKHWNRCIFSGNRSSDATRLGIHDHDGCCYHVFLTRNLYLCHFEHEVLWIQWWRTARVGQVVDIVSHHDSVDDFGICDLARLGEMKAAGRWV